MSLFKDIPKFTRSATYMVNVSLNYLPWNYLRYVTYYGLDVSPDFQRNYVWNLQQKTRFVEYILQGGTSGLDIYTNCPTWRVGDVGPEYPEAHFVLVDGKQRLDASLGFLNNEFPIFGHHYFRDYTDRLGMCDASFRWHVNDLATYEEVLQWYLDLNTGGTVHTEDELTKVRDLLEKKVAYVRPSAETIFANANLGREVIQAEVAREEEERARSLRAREEAAAKKPQRGKRAKK